MLMAGDADLRDELQTKSREQKEQTNLGGDSEYPKLRTAGGKKAPTSWNAVMNDMEPWETMLTDDITGKADMAGEILAKRQELKDLEAKYPELRIADAQKAPKSSNAVVDDPVTVLDKKLIDADIAGDADLRDEPQTKIQEQKEQTILDGESE